MKNMKTHYSRSHANRGLKLEMLVEMTNNQYRNAWLADIRKVPTPVKILKTEGNKVSGHLDTETWVDYWQKHMNIRKLEEVQSPFH